MKRRSLLKWVPPIVLAVTLPAHGQSSINANPCEDVKTDIELISVSPSSGSINKDETVTARVRYSIENPPENMSSPSIWFMLQKAGDTVGFVEIFNITDMSGEVDIVWTYDTPSTAVEPDGAAYDLARATLSWEGNCVPGLSDEQAIDLFLESHF